MFAHICKRTNSKTNIKEGGGSFCIIVAMSEAITGYNTHRVRNLCKVMPLIDCKTEWGHKKLQEYEVRTQILLLSRGL